MDETRFWSMIEAAWQSIGGKTKPRQKLVEGKLSDEKCESLMETLDEEVVIALTEELQLLTPEALSQFDRILERKLYEIDRAEVQEATDGSNDGFLYARGFIVGMGRTFYDAVNANPSLAIMDMECEAMCYISWHVFREKYGEMPRSEISRESCSNRAGWPAL